MLISKWLPNETVDSLLDGREMRLYPSGGEDNACALLSLLSSRAPARGVRFPNSNKVLIVFHPRLHLTLHHMLAVQHPLPLQSPAMSSSLPPPRRGRGEHVRLCVTSLSAWLLNPTFPSKSKGYLLPSRASLPRGMARKSHPEQDEDPALPRPVVVVHLALQFPVFPAGASA